MALPANPQAALEAVEAYHNWYHRIELAPGIVTPGTNDSGRVLEMLDLPESLAGKRVLDLGTRDGFFAFEAERRGAEVIAVDYMPAEATGFALAARILSSNVTYVQENIYNCGRERFGEFDVIFMLGLLYHLRDPLGALDVVRELAGGRVYVETYVCDDQIFLADGSKTALASVDARLTDTPIMAFLSGMALNADPTNFWAPNTACVAAMLHEADFSVASVKRVENRALLAADIRRDDHTLYHRRIARGEMHP